MKRLELLDPLPNTVDCSAFRQAALLAEDPSINKWYEDTILAKFPDSSSAISLTEEQWMKEHPRPSGRIVDDYKKWNEQHFAAIQEWLKRWPNSSYLIIQQYTEVRSLPNLSAETVSAIIDKYMTLLESNPEI